MEKYLPRVPAFQKWQEAMPQTNDSQGFQFFTARVDQMICFADVFWPEFVEQDGLILRKSNVPDDWNDYVAKAQKANWSASDYEYIINHLHIMDLFINDPDRDNIGVEVFVFLAQTIAEMWKCKLKALFPTRTFVVGVANPEVEPEVFAYSER